MRSPQWVSCVLGCVVICLGMVAPGRARGDPVVLAEDGSFEMARATWRGQVDAGEAVVVANAFGDIRVRFGGYEGAVEVIATLQHFSDEGPPLVLEGTDSADGVEIAVGFVRDEDEWVTRRQPKSRKRADLVVFVPHGARLDASVDDGLLEIRKLKSDVKARTVSGQLVVRGIEGDLDLTTDSGNIVANLIPRQAGGEQAIASGSGDVSVHLNQDVNLTVQVVTEGLISTDFSMQIDPVSDEPRRKRGQAVIGKGTTQLKLESHDGHIRLFRRPLARKARLRPRPSP